MRGLAAKVAGAVVVATAMVVVAPMALAPAGADPAPGAVVWASQPLSGVVPNGDSTQPAFGTGALAFTSEASNLVAGDTNGQPDIFVRDLASGEITRASLGIGGAQIAGRSHSPSLSDDDRLLAFLTNAPLVPQDTDTLDDAYVRDLSTGEVRLVSASYDTWAPLTTQRIVFAKVTGPGDFVAYGTEASGATVHLAEGWVHGFGNSRVVDVDDTGMRALVARIPPGGNGFTPPLVPCFPESCSSGALSADGTVRMGAGGALGRGSVLVRDWAGNPVTGATHVAMDDSGRWGLFSTVRDCCGRAVTGGGHSGITEWDSHLWVRDALTGQITSASPPGYGRDVTSRPAISGDGTRIAWSTTSPLGDGDPTHVDDIALVTWPRPADAATGTISGTVTDPDGYPVAAATIHVVDQVTRDVDAVAVAGEDGTYSVAVPPGPHQVLALDIRDRLPAAWAPGTPTAADAAVHQVEVGQATTVDVHLPWPTPTLAPSEAQVVVASDVRVLDDLAGRWLLYEKTSGGLWRHDTETGTEVRVDVDPSRPALVGAVNGYHAQISADGRYVAYEAAAGHLGGPSIHRRDLTTGTTVEVSPADDGGRFPSMSDDGQVIAYEDVDPVLSCGFWGCQVGSFASRGLAAWHAATGTTVALDPADPASARLTAFDVSADGSTVLYDGRLIDTSTAVELDDLDLRYARVSGRLDAGDRYVATLEHSGPGGEDQVGAPKVVPHAWQYGLRWDRATGSARPFAARPGGMPITTVTVEPTPEAMVGSAGGDGRWVTWSECRGCSTTRPAYLADLHSGTTYPIPSTRTDNPPLVDRQGSVVAYATGGKLFARALPALPSAPTVHAPTPGPRTLTVTWDPPADEGSSPVAWYSIDLYRVGEDAPVASQTAPPDDRERTFWGLDPELQYTVRVTARTQVHGWDSPPSPPTTPISPQPPLEQAPWMWWEVGPSSITLHIDPPSETWDPAGFEVRHHAGGSETPTSVQTHPGDERTIVVADLAPGTHRIDVATLNAAGVAGPANTTGELTVAGGGGIDVAVTDEAGDPVDGGYLLVTPIGQAGLHVAPVEAGTGHLVDLAPGAFLVRYLDPGGRYDHAVAQGAPGRVGADPVVVEVGATTQVAVEVEPFPTGVTELAAHAVGGVLPDAGAKAPSLSANGRYVAFESGSTNVVGGATGDQVYVLDRQTGTVALASATAGGTAAGGASTEPVVADDGRVAFLSTATDLSPADPDPDVDAYVFDPGSGTVALASRASGPGGAPADQPVTSIDLSVDGTTVAFTTAAATLGATDGRVHAYVRDLAAATTEVVDLALGGGPAGGDASGVTLDGTGDRVGFVTTASDLVAGDTNGLPDAYVRDRSEATTLRASFVGQEPVTAVTGVELSADGSTAVFRLGMTPIGGGADIDGLALMRLDTGVPDLVTWDPAGIPLQASAGEGFDVSADGRYVVYTMTSAAVWVTPMPSGAPVEQAYRYDTHTGHIDAVALTHDWRPLGADVTAPSISADGGTVAFVTAEDALVDGHSGTTPDVFVRELG